VPLMTPRPVLVLAVVGVLGGCVSRETVREVLVPAPIPSLCTSACPAPEGVPKTNGELAEAWAARGEAIQCYIARQACVREMVAKPDAKKGATPVGGP